MFLHWPSKRFICADAIPVANSAIRIVSKTRVALRIKYLLYLNLMVDLSGQATWNNPDSGAFEDRLF
jgi:hypothetical protein